MNLCDQVTNPGPVNPMNLAMGYLTEGVGVGLGQDLGDGVGVT